MANVKQPRIVKDILDAIYGDSWIWCVCHGDPRCGKSTLCMQIAYQVYKDPNLVLNSIVFNLPQLIHKMKKGIPCKWPTANGLHDRVPLIIWDDFGAYSNKSVTQHTVIFDYFKASFDTLATKIAVIIANMVSPTAPTQQLAEKFNAELWIPYRGYYKYDKVRAGQDYYGFRPQIHKDWLDEGTFGKVPKDVFLAYDSMRMSLADETIQKMEDVIIDTELETLLRKIHPIDVELLKLITKLGPLHTSRVESELGQEGKEAIVRLKSRQLIVPVRVGYKYYKYDTTDLADELLKALARPPTLTDSTISTDS